ncbi:hypothetical protein SKTS_36770 [Sulfurimicrobium lacus]|uniref:Uncharacterized protein n=1 Tax=Sulfurimicrobium lacus TaxID=2715678 RepID=A0A6F8VHZ8_9PROT|nr:hypothetical protein SKTS_36770 [Sulfurimicrobium lacus]
MRKFAQSICCLKKIDVFVGKVDAGFHQHPEVDQARHDFMYGAGKFTLQRAQGAFSRLFTTCVYQVCDALGLRQIELVVKKGALCELTGLGQACAEIQTPLEQALHHGVSTMALQFKHVFTGKGMRRGEKQRDALIYDRTVTVLEIA